MQVILFNSNHANMYLAVNSSFYYFFYPTSYDFSTCVLCFGYRTNVPPTAVLLNLLSHVPSAVA